MFDCIEQGIVSAHDADFTARLASQRSRRADLEQEILWVERQLSAADRRVTPDAVGRLGEVILGKLRRQTRSRDRAMLAGLSPSVVVAPDLITITGPIKPLAIAANDGPDNRAPMVLSIDREWCRMHRHDGHSNHWRYYTLRTQGGSPVDELLGQITPSRC